MQATDPSEQPRLQHLRDIERTQVERFAKMDLYKVDAPADYSQLSFEQKNSEKFMCTFPYPYMNGYLHLGKFASP